MTRGDHVREFSVEEANGLLPRLTLEFGRMARLRDEIVALSQALGGAAAAVAILQEQREPTADQQQPAARLREVTDDIRRAVARIHELGCIVKDVELGLVDFNAQVDGKRVFLCWQFGEPAVGYFHGLGDGFEGREPLPAQDVGPVPARGWVN